MSKILKVLYDGEFKIKEITDEDSNIYSLEGFCCQCGKCCLDPKHNAGYNDESGKCSKLIYETVNGKIKYRCSIYGHRPISCMLWPISEDEISKYSECTYKFVKK